MMSMPRVLSPAISVLVAIPQLIKHPSCLVSGFPFPQEVTSPNGWARRVRNSIDQVSQKIRRQGPRALAADGQAQSQMPKF
jgi:hypothetical protein